MIVNGVRDFKSAWQKKGICWRLARDDLKLRYKRTIFGPFWLTMLMAVHITGLGLVFGTTFQSDLGSFLPYIAFGMIIWQFIASSLQEGTSLFETNTHLIGNINLPYSFYAIRSVIRILINFSHNLAIIFVILIFFDFEFSFALLTLFPAVLLLSITSFACILLLGVVSVRFKDIEQLITAVITLAFLMTPIIWKKQFLMQHAWLVDFNPFFHYIEIVRAPLLEGRIAEVSWAVCGGLTSVFVVLSLSILGKYRNRIPYWL